MQPVAYEPMLIEIVRERLRSDPEVRVLILVGSDHLAASIRKKFENEPSRFAGKDLAVNVFGLSGPLLGLRVDWLVVGIDVPSARYRQAFCRLTRHEITFVS